MPSCLYWDVNDPDGENPLEKPGEFEFRVWYEIDPGDTGYFYHDDCCSGYGPGADLIDIECVSIRFAKDAESRPANPDESAMLSDWFFHWLDFHADVRNEIECKALEYSYVGAVDDSADVL